MNDFYSAASQVIPVLLLAIVIDLSPAGERAVGPYRYLARAAAFAGLFGELLALGGLSFDEEEQTTLNTVVAAIVWTVLILLLCASGWSIWRHSTRSRTELDGNKGAK